MRQCTKCKEIKDESRFLFSIKENRYSSHCRVCKNAKHAEWAKENQDKIKAYRQTEQSRVNQKKYDESEKGRSRHRKHQKSDNGKQKRYQARKARYHQPEINRKHNARAAVSRAIKKGLLLHPGEFICSNCNQSQAEHYHHHKGYSIEYQLDVVPVCQQCHLILG